jgi:hypothetical protein
MVALLHTFEIIALAAIWALAGYALLPLRLRKEELCLVWSTALALGAGLTAVAMTALAAADLLHRTSVLAVTCAVALVAAGGARQVLRERPCFVRPDLSNWPERIAAAALAVVLALGLLATLAPPSSMDATVYHLWVPREFLRAHSWVNLESPHSYQPMYVEMLFGQGLVLGGGVLAALVHWALAIGALGAAAAWGARLGGPRLWPAALLAATGLYTWESTSAFIDLALALFASLALLWSSRTETDSAPSVLAGLFAGLAAGSKFTGLAAAMLAGAVGGASLWPNRGAAVKRFLIVGVLAVLVSCPWYLRNFAFTGNPIYPLASGLFGLPDPGPFSGWNYGVGRDLLHLVTSPFDLLARGDAFDRGWSIGPAFLAFVPLGFMRFGDRRAARVALVSLLAWWVFWFYSSPQTRLLLPVLPVAAGLAGLGIHGALSSPRWMMRSMAIAVLVVAGVGGVGTAILSAVTYGRAALGLEPSELFLRRNSWHFHAYENANRLLPPDARVAVSGASNLYYLDRRAQHLKKDVSTESLKAQGYTHGLRVGDCAALAQLRSDPELVLWEGRYPLRLSRLRGGVAGEACARLISFVSEGHAPDAGR